MSKPIKARIYFAESDASFWFKRWFLKPGFSHCFIVINGVLLNPAYHCLQVIPDAGPVYECTTYIDMDMKEPKFVKRTIWEVSTCVTTIKQVLGIDVYGIFTPAQLHDYLLKEKSHRIT